MRLTTTHISGLLAVFMAFAAYGDNPGILMEKANQAYMNETYYEAIELYESIRGMQWESAALYYNLGNAYYQTGQHGKAILNYERARRLSPNDAAIQHNLRLARTEIIDNFEHLPQLFFLEWRDQFIRLQSVDGWAKTLVVLVIALAICTGLFFVAGKTFLKKLFFTVGMVLLFASLAALYSVNRQYYLNHVRQEAVIMAPRITAKSAPSERGVDLFALHEGTTVLITTELQDWFEVKLPNGNTGWIRKTALEVI